MIGPDWIYQQAARDWETPPDFDSFETADEAIYFEHHEHAECDCETCLRYLESL